MKKRLSFVCAALVFSLLFISCKNFLEGSSIINELESMIEYANSPYVTVEFAADIDATNKMSPFVGTYDKNYKKGDSIELSYEPKNSYVFLGWKATPEGSVIFDDEDKSSLKTKATIKSEENLIVIEPIVCARPTVSFLPSNAVAVEKDTDVIITFSHELNLTDEVTLDLIKIVDEFGNEIQSTNFLPPVLDETKKVIIFKSNPENFISFEGNTLGITVKVPAVYNYLYENTKVCMEKDTEYSYKINQETSTKLKLSVAAITPEKGSMNLSGAQEFNIGQKQILTINIKDEEYKFYGWIVQNENGTKLEKEIYELYFSFDDDKAKETYINVKNTGSGFTIVPDLKQRPQVETYYPQFSKVGVDRGTDIQILFDMPMSEESIYWTAAELDELGITNYEAFKAIRYDEGCVTETEIKKDEDQPYYYGYKDKDGKAHFKNIEITINGEPYLSGDHKFDDDYFTAPYFQTPTMLVIPTAKEIFKEEGSLNVKELPPNSYVDFVIGKAMVNKEEVPLYKDYTKTYYVNSHYDTRGPIIKDGDGCHIAGTSLTPLELYQEYNKQENKEEYFKNRVFYTTKPIATAFNMYSDIYAFTENLPEVKPVKTLIVFDCSVYDVDGITEVVLLLEFCKSGIYKEPVPGYETIEISQTLPNKDTFTFDHEENRVVFDVSTIPAQGIYKVKLLALDSLGNKGLISYSVTSYCMIDNSTKIKKEDITVTKESYNKYLVKAPVGEYAIIEASKWNAGLSRTLTTSNFLAYFVEVGDRKKKQELSKENNYSATIEKYEVFNLDNLGDHQVFLLARNIFGTLTIFEMIEHEGTFELKEYIPPEV